jgi:hypothetical protein
MEKLPARAGWEWLKEGFALFRKRPTELLTLFLSYMFLMFVVGIIPLFGQVLPMVLVPVFSMAFMLACVHVEQGKKVHPGLLLTGFRSPARMRLLQLGALYLLAAVIAIAASALVDGGVFWKVMSGQSGMDANTVRGSNMSMAMVFAALVYTPAAMGFWYAAPLVAWHDMGVGKAIFYSFFAVKRSGKAFLVYGLAWLLVGVFVPVLASSIVALLFGKAAIVMLILLPLSIIMSVVMYCSFYPTYTRVFGKPDPEVTNRQ